MIDAIRNWATRRERVTYYAAATLIEFGSTRERDEALASWPAGELAAPIDVGDRFLLVADDRTVPFDRLRLIASRDYRRPAEVCVTVEADGDLAGARSGSLGPPGRRRAGAVRRRGAAQTNPREAKRGPALRRFVVSVAQCAGAWAEACPRLSLPSGTRDGLEQGSRPRSGSCSRRRSHASRRSKPRKSSSSSLPTLRSPRRIGPASRPRSPLLGERLGPTAVTIADDQLGPLQKALKGLGIDLDAIE